MTIATVRGGVPTVFVPAGVVAFRERPGAIPSPVSGISGLALGAGETLSFAVGAFMIAIAADEAPEAAWTSRWPTRAALGLAPYVAAVGLAHGFFIGLSARSASAAAFEDEPPSREAMARYLASAEARSAATDRLLQGSPGESNSNHVNDQTGNGKASGGARAAGTEGSMGSAAQRPAAAARHAVAHRPDRSQEGALSREEAIADARGFGMIGVLSAADASRSPFASFGQAVASGRDAIGARGDLWGTAMGETAGSGGLGLSGIGEGGGGNGLGIGLGRIGTFGHGAGDDGSGSGGLGTDSAFWASSWRGGSGYGRFLPRLPRGATTSAPDIRMGAPIVLAALKSGGHAKTAEERAEEKAARSGYGTAVQRAARQNFGYLRLCLENATRTHRIDPEASPNLGRVAVRVLFSADGAPLSAVISSSSLSFPDMAECVTRAFERLSVPPSPGGGSRTVTFPLTFGWKAR